MKLFWSFEKSGPNRYRLIGIDNYGTALMRAEYAPGYESRRLKDILQAAWYLNSSGKIRICVDDHQAAILEQIRRDAADQGIKGGECYGISENL